MSQIVHETIRETLRPSTVRETLMDGNGGGGPPLHALALVDRDGNAILARNQLMIVTRGAYPAPVTWEYASLALAEASGDDWANLDYIQITGGPKFQYRAAAANDGYSGLIHDDPHNLGESLDSVILDFSTPKNVDPDTWDDATTQVGTNGVIDTDGGRSRFRQTGSNTSYYARGFSDHVPTAEDENCFAIFDGVTHAATSGGGCQSRYIAYLRARCWSQYYGATRQGYVDIGVRTSGAGGPLSDWRINASPSSSGTGTGISRGTEGRFWVYLSSIGTNQTRVTVWHDDDATPLYSSIIGETFSLDNALRINVNGDTAVSTNQIKLIQALHGSFAAS